MRVKRDTPAISAIPAIPVSHERAGIEKNSKNSRNSSQPFSNSIFDGPECNGRCQSCREPCAPRNPAEQGTVARHLPCVTCGHRSDCGRLLDGSVSFADLTVCSGDPGEATRVAYPDQDGQVKCTACSRLDMTGNTATCRLTGTKLDGLSLLRVCGQFSPKEP